MSAAFVPREYQAMSVEFIVSNKRCALWSSMGTGKTVATLTALDAILMSGEEGPVLVLGPKRVARTVWSTEVRKWAHTEHMVVSNITGTVADRLAAIRRKADIYTINYENLEWIVDYWGDRWPYKIVIADEATKLKGLRLSVQHGRKKDGSQGKEFITGQGGKRAKALGMIAHKYVDRFIQLTGTPAPNGLKDLWGQMWFLDAGKRLGRTYESFKDRWFAANAYDRSLKPREYAEAQIHAALQDVCMTIDAKDYFDLADPIVNDIYVDLPLKARRLYKEMEDDMFIQIADRSAEAFGAAAKTQKCLQLACGAIYVDPLANCDSHPKAKEWREIHDAKLEALEDVIEEANGAPVIVVYEFRSDLARLQKAFPKGRVLSSQKDENDFKAGKIQVLFTHPASAGHGIDGFQNVCNQMAFFGFNWSLEQRQQIIERIGPVRQMQAGLDRPVFIHNIVARDTVDELVLERHATKRETQDILLDALKRR